MIQPKNEQGPGQVGGKQPGFRIAFIPAQHEMGGNSVGCGEFDCADEATIAAPGDETIQSYPRLGVWQLRQDVSRLTQSIIPAPRLHRL